MSDQKRTIEIKVSLDDARAIATAKAESKAFDEAGKSADKLSREVNQLTDNHKGAASSMSAVASRAGSMAGKLLGATAAYVSISAAVDGYSRALSYIGDVGGQFEQSMANTRAILQPTENQFQALAQSAKNLGATTVFTASQASDAYTELGKLGFDTAQILSAGNDVLVLAAAANLNMADAATASATVVRQFGLTAAQTGEVVDIMAKSFSISALDAQNFTEAMQYVGPAAKSAGISVSETSAALGVLADNGIKGSIAGTGLRRIILELSDSTSKASRAVRDINPNAQTLVEKMQALKKAGLDTTSATELFRVEASTAAIILSSGTETLNKYGDALRYAEEGSKGFAKGVADTQLDTFQGDLKLTQSALESAAIAFAEAFGPAARDSVQMLTGKLGDLTQWANDNPDKLRQWAKAAETTFSAVTKSAEGLLFVVSKVNDAFSSIAGGDVASAVPEERFIQVADKIVPALEKVAKAKEEYEKADLRLKVTGTAGDLGDLLVASRKYKEAKKELQDLNEERARLFSGMIEYRDALNADVGRSDQDQKTLDKLNQMLPIAAEAVRLNKSYAQSVRDAASAEADRLKNYSANKPLEQTKAGGVSAGISSQETIDKASKEREDAIRKADAQYIKLLRERELAELDSDRRALNELMYHWDQVIAIDEKGGARHIELLEKMRDEAIAKMLRPTDIETVYEVRGRIAPGGMTPTAPAEQVYDGGAAAADAARQKYEAVREERYNAAVQVQEDLIQANKTEEQIEMESYQTRLELLREFNLDEQALTAEHNAKMKDLNMLRLQQAAGLATNLGMLAKQVAGDNKAAMVAYKVLASAGAVVDTYAAANKAFSAAGGWPWGVIPAAASVAYGLTNVAAINGVHFAQGTKSTDASFGRVGGAQYSGDKIPAWLTSGETVLSRSESDDYFANKSNSGNFTMNYSPTYSGEVSELTKRKDMRMARRSMRAIQNDRTYGRAQAAITW